MKRITPQTTKVCVQSDSDIELNAESKLPLLCSSCRGLLFEDHSLEDSSKPNKSSSDYNNNNKGFQEETTSCQEKELRFDKDFQAGSKKSDLEDKNTVEKVRISCRGIDVEIDFKTCDNIYVNDLGTLQLNYSFRITGQDDYQFCMKNLKTDEETSYKKIIGEGSLVLEFPEVSSKFKNHSEHGCTDRTTPDYHNSPIQQQEEVISASSSKQTLSGYSDTLSSKEVSCETIEIILNEVAGDQNNVTPQEDRTIEIVSTFGKVCNNCSRVVEQENIYHCLFGHDSCKQCKGKPCMLCQNMMGDAKSYCKNHHKGCSIFQTQELLTKHEIDCEFNNFRCPFPRCVFLNTLTDLKTHFLNSHTKSLIQSNTILEVLNGKKDRKWYLYCFGSLFVCSYYFYGTHIEFILQYIGANDNAKSFRFEAEIKTMKDKKLLKRALCAGWNDLSLCKGVYFDYEDLNNCDNSRFQFTANLRIVNISNNGLYSAT